MTPPGPVPYDVGEGAIVAEFPSSPEEEANRRAVALGKALLASGTEGLRDAIPGARTLLLVFDPSRLSHERARELVASASAGAAPSSAGRSVTIAVCYGGEFGPDLAELASRAGRTPDELASRHAAGDYTVAFLGFAPGFAYLSGLEPMLHSPRLSTPRPRVPAGSVAIGGPYTGIYPSPTPGGWRLIGRSAVRLFDEETDPPARLAPGDAVGFEQVGRERLDALERDLAAAAARTDTSPGGRPVFRVVKPGLFTSVQGVPRWQRGGAGIPPGGAMDEAALEAGNARLGNSASAPALEMTLLGPELEALGDVGICLSGAALAAERNGAPIFVKSPARVAVGDRLRFGPTRGAARAYLCIEGGLLAPGRLGLTRRLEAGEILMAASGASFRRREDSKGAPSAARAREGASGEVRLRVLLDPRRERFFDAGAVGMFLETPYRVSATSDRRGIRLEGAPLASPGSSEMPPEGTPLGAIQVPADGQPIVLGPDRPITGGYARIGAIIEADWPLVAQAPPGRTVRFSSVSMQEALEARSSI